MNIVFRTDASNAIGTGHVTRCLTLANALRKEGANVLFVCRKHPGHLIERIESQGFDVVALPVTDQTRIDSSKTLSSEETLAHTHWLGSDWQTDAEATIEALGDTQLDLLVVDHYGLDYRWESALKEHVKRIMVIDDLADRKHECDLLLDQNYGSSADRYRGLVPLDCAQCHGPEYALLKPVYAECRTQQPARDGQVRRVLIYFGGGADAVNLTYQAVQAFQAPELAHIELDIVVGASYAHHSSLEELVAQRGKAAIHRQLPDLANLMANADLAIGAGGATTWERCCLGLPSILVVCALNQEKIGQGIANLGAGVVLYPSVNFSAEIREQVVSLSKDTNLYLQMGYRSKRICDGLGVSRVTKEIISILSNANN